MNNVIMGIPRIPQAHWGWCGHTILAMVLRYWGYNYSPEDILEHVNGRSKTFYDEDIYGYPAYVTMGQLAIAVMRLTNLRVSLANSELYRKLINKRPNFTPYDLLRASIYRGYPCIIHHIDHFYIVYGFCDSPERYWLKDGKKMGCYIYLRPASMRYGEGKRCLRVVLVVELFR